MLLFWQDVTDYGAAEDRSADRLLRLNYAWTIFRKYMTENSDTNIGQCCKNLFNFDVIKEWNVH